MHRMHDGHWDQVKKKTILTPVKCPPSPLSFSFFVFSFVHGLMDRVSNIQKAHAYENRVNDDNTVQNNLIPPNAHKIAMMRRRKKTKERKNDCFSFVKCS